MLVVSRILWGARKGWEQRGLGLTFPPRTDPLTHILFADDIFLVGVSEDDLLAMLRDMTSMLFLAGLALNEEKMSFICSSKGKGKRLPGKCCNQTGMKILGRLIGREESTDLDLEARLKQGHWKYSIMRPVLQQNTPLKHKLRVLQATVLQSILWASETWSPTKVRLSRPRGVHLYMLRGILPIMQLDHSEGAPHKRVQHDRYCIAKVQKAGFDMLDVLFLRSILDGGGHVCRLPRERHARWLLE